MMLANRKKWMQAKRKEAIAAYLFTLPAFLILFGFHIMPAFVSLWLSLFEWNGLTDKWFIGIDNFIQAVQDKAFLKSIVNTFLLAAISIPLSLSLATVTAVLLNQKIRGLAMYRTIYFIPVVTMMIAVGVIWKWMYNSDFGLINILLGYAQLPQPNWLTDPAFIMLSIALVAVWSNIGYNVVILLAGLQGISGSYYEAAEIDGASPVHKFFRITLPLLTPSLFFLLVISLISTLQVFDLIFVMTNGNSTLLETARTMVYGIYEQGFINFNMGYASAQAVLLFVIIMIITLIQMRWQKRWVHY
ncbi:carbohydrate ABC transporter permease [Paenibacillus chungangensis]|uniref:Carbohydrate ABC transporter permease n=1 Tax=Paenibacillus chungangensis TaxID=696535 RepID=A0ABW3HQI9_9BACL